MFLFKITVSKHAKISKPFTTIPKSHQQHAVTNKGEQSVFQPKQVPRTVSLAKSYHYNGIKSTNQVHTKICSQYYNNDYNIHIYSFHLYITLLTSLITHPNISVFFYLFKQWLHCNILSQIYNRKWLQELYIHFQNSVSRPNI